MLTEVTHMKIHKNAPMNGVIHITGDKSISHRSVMFGAIADGTTVVKNFLMEPIV